MARRSITNPPPGTVLCCTEPTGKCIEDHCNGQNASHKESPEFMREEGESYGRKAREVKQNSIRTIPCLPPAHPWAFRLPGESTSRRRPVSAVSNAKIEGLVHRDRHESLSYIAAVVPRLHD